MKASTQLFMMFVVLAVSMAFPGRTLAADQGGDVAGYIDQILGEVYFKETPSATPKRLTRANVRQLLRTGERLRCGQGGYLKICLYDRCMEIKGPSGWYPIPRIPLSESDPRRIALRNFGGGGRPRGSGAVIFSPADDSVVAPERFTIRWVTSDGDSNIALAILNDISQVIWQQKDVDAVTGQLISESARETLLQYRSGRGKGLLTLVLVHPNEQSEQARFSVLSSENDWSLQQELMKLDREEASLLRHAYRAYAFSTRGMVTEAVEEYEAALAETPESHDLLIATIIANRNIGNSSRVDELMKRLSPATKTPR